MYPTDGRLQLLHCNTEKSAQSPKQRERRENEKICSNRGNNKNSPKYKTNENVSNPKANEMNRHEMK